jgi:hypothetical protein
LAQPLVADLGPYPLSLLVAVISVVGSVIHFLTERHRSPVWIILALLVGLLWTAGDNASRRRFYKRGGATEWVTESHAASIREIASKLANSGPMMGQLRAPPIFGDHDGQVLHAHFPESAAVLSTFKTEWDSAGDGERRLFEGIEQEVRIQAERFGIPEQYLFGYLRRTMDYPRELGSFVIVNADGTTSHYPEEKLFNPDDIQDPSGLAEWISRFGVRMDAVTNQHAVLQVIRLREQTKITAKLTADLASRNLQLNRFEARPVSCPECRMT